MLSFVFGVYSMVLIELLNREFKLYGIEKFIHPLYYSFPIGLRFKLGIAAINISMKWSSEYALFLAQRLLLRTKFYSYLTQPPDKELKSILFYYGK